MLPVDFFKIAGHLIEIFLNNSHILVKLWSVLHTGMFKLFTLVNVMPFALF